MKNIFATLTILAALLAVGVPFTAMAAGSCPSGYTLNTNFVTTPPRVWCSPPAPATQYFQPTDGCFKMSDNTPVDCATGWSASPATVPASTVSSPSTSQTGSGTAQGAADTLSSCVTSAAGVVVCGDTSNVVTDLNTNPAQATAGLPSGVSCGGVTCPAGDSCQAGVCTATSCGTSGNSCPAGESCQAGVCTASDVSGPKDCSGASSAASYGGIGSQLVGAAINRLCGGGRSCAALQMGLSGNVGAATATLCGGGRACSLIGGILNQSSIGQLINSNVNGVMSTLTGGINQAFNSLTNGISSALSGLGNSISSALGFGGSAVSSVGNAVGSAAASGAASAGASTAGGAAASAGGSAASALAMVPVTAPLTDIAVALAATNITTNATGIGNTTNAHLKAIHSDQDTQLQVTCVYNPMVRAASHQFAAQFSSQVLNALTTGNGGGPYYQASYPGAQNFTLDSAVNYAVSIMGSLGANQRFVGPAQQNFVNNYTYTNDLSQQLRCDVPSGIDSNACAYNSSACGSTDTERAKNFYLANSEPGCTQEGTNRVLGDWATTQSTNRVAYQNFLYQQAGGYTPKIKCLKPEGYTGPSEGCAVFQITTPAGGVQTIANQGTTLGSEQQARASEIGSLVDSLLSQLASQALTSLMGLSGLSQSSNGNSSYLDQLTNQTTTSTVAAQASSLQSAIESAMGTEATYESILNSNITSLSSAQSALLSVRSCYLTLATSTATALPSVTALANADAASTTIATVLAPQLTSQNTLLTSSENVLLQLNTLDNQVQVAQSTTDITNVSNAYQALSSSGAMHTTSDIAAAQTDSASSTPIISALATNALQSLSQCQAGK